MRTQKDIIAEVNNDVIAIHQLVNEGIVLQSLSEKLAQVSDISSPRFKRKTTVNLPDTEEAVMQLAKQKHHPKEFGKIELLSNESYLTDDELQLIVDNLASPNPLARDKSGFFFLGDLIQAGILSERQMLFMVKHFIDDEVLFSHILEPENDAIYLRAFAPMMLSMLLLSHRVKKAFISNDLMVQIIRKMSMYALLERDGRGFIKTNGWAHAFTHIANVMHELTHTEGLTRADNLFLVTSMLVGYQKLEMPLVTGETQRLAGVVIDLVNQHTLYEEAMVNQLKLWQQKMMRSAQPQDEASWHQVFNTTRFFQALALHEDALPDSITKLVESSRDYLA